MSNQLQITGDLKVKSLTGALTASAGVVASVPLGTANGVATLGSDGKVPSAQLPTMGSSYKGTWNAATNTPYIVDGVGTAGDYYLVSTGGTWNGIVFLAGNTVIYSGTVWQKAGGGSGTVTSVALAAPAAFSVSGSPVTSTGTLTLAGAGAATDYIKGDGTLSVFNSAAISAVSGTYLPLAGGLLTGELAIRTNTTTGLNIISSTGTQALWVRAGYDTDGTATPIVSANNIQFQSSGSAAGSFSFVIGNSKALFIASNAAATFSSSINATSAIFSTQLKVSNPIGSALDMIVLETGFDNPSGNKSIIWKDATSPLGRISVSYDAGLGGSTMRFGSLYNGGYQTSDLLTIAPNGSATFSSSITATQGIFSNISSITNADQSGARLIISNTGTGGQAVNLVAGNPNVDNTGFSIAYGNTNFLRFASTGAATFSSSVTAGSFVTPSTGGVGSTTWSLLHDQTTAGDFGIYAPAGARIYFNAAGNVGIGTSSPNGKFNVSNGGAEGIEMWVQSATATNLIQSYNRSTSVWNSLEYKAADHIFYGSGTERMRITSGGNVLIGTTTDNGAKLNVNGAATFSSTITSTNSAGTFLNATNTAGGFAKLEISGNATSQATLSFTNSLLITGGSTSFSDSITATTAVFNGYSINNNPTSNGTGSTFTRYLNTGGDFYIGIENSAGSFFGATAYANIMYMGSTNFEMFWSGTRKVTFTSGGSLLLNTNTDLGAGYKLQVNGSISMAYANFFNFKGSSGAGDVIVDNSGSSLRVTGAVQLSNAVTFNSTALVLGLLTNYNVYNTQTSSYTLVLSDASKIIEMNVATSNTVTIPNNSSVAFPIGTEITVMQYGGGVTSIEVASGVTIVSKGLANIIANRYTGATLIKRATNEWYLIGNIVI